MNAHPRPCNLVEFRDSEEEGGFGRYRVHHFCEVQDEPGFLLDSRG